MMYQALTHRRRELENVMKSFPADDDRTNLRPAEIGVVCALKYLKYVDNEHREGLLGHVRKTYRSADSNGWRLLLWHTREFPPDNNSSVIHSDCVPPFPWGCLMVPLWDNCTNWRVLQASVHEDNFAEE